MNLYSFIENACGAIKSVSDSVWDFPTQFDWYCGIPVLGRLPLVVILLVGSGIYFSFRLRFVQIRRFSHGLRVLFHRSDCKNGISPMASFLLSTAMRVGPGNILGVTGAISTGGPGALFWMWTSAFFGMATAFVESTLAQLFREKKGSEYVGGFSYYGRKLLGGSAVVGVVLSVIYMLYALLCLPAQGYNTISSIGQVAQGLCGAGIENGSLFYWIAFALLTVLVGFVSFGGIRKVTRLTDVLVPAMAVIYMVMVLVLICMNPDRLPVFFHDVFVGAFKPDAVFGGAFGIALSQGIRRGLMSNEAGQGTMTMAAASSDVEKAGDQGCIQAVGVFLDTMVICTLTGFVVVMGQMWEGDGADAWFAMGKLPRFIASARSLAGTGLFGDVTSMTMTLCFALFAFTTLLGFISFTEICASRISKGKTFTCTVRCLCIGVVAFGTVTSIEGFDLAALWNLSDFANIVMVLVNLPLLYLGLKYVVKEA